MKRAWVCENCRTAACWLGEFMCEGAITRKARVIQQTHAACKRLGREHYDYYSRPEVQVEAGDTRVHL